MAKHKFLTPYQAKEIMREWEQLPEPFALLPILVRDMSRTGFTVPLPMNGDIEIVEGVPLRAGKAAGHPRVRLHFTTSQWPDEPLLRDEKERDAVRFPSVEAFVLIDVDDSCRKWEKAHINALARKVVASAKADLEDALVILEAAQEDNLATRLEHPEYKAAVEKRDAATAMMHALKGAQGRGIKSLRDGAFKDRDEAQADMDRLATTIDVDLDVSNLKQQVSNCAHALREAWKNAFNRDKYRAAFLKYLRSGRKYPKLPLGEKGGEIGAAMGKGSVAFYELEMLGKKGEVAELVRTDVMGIPMSGGGERTLVYPLKNLLDLLEPGNLNQIKIWKKHGYIGFAPLTGKGEVNPTGGLLGNIGVVGNVLLGRHNEKLDGWQVVLEKQVLLQILKAVDFYRKFFLEAWLKLALMPESAKAALPVPEKKEKKTRNAREASMSNEKPDLAEPGIKSKEDKMPDDPKESEGDVQPESEKDDDEDDDADGSSESEPSPKNGASSASALLK